MNKNLKADDVGGGYFKLNSFHIKALLKDGFCYVETTSGNVIKVTDKDLYLDRNDVGKLKGCSNSFLKPVEVEE